MNRKDLMLANPFGMYISYITSSKKLKICSNLQNTQCTRDLLMDKAQYADRTTEAFPSNFVKLCGWPGL